MGWLEAVPVPKSDILKRLEKELGHPPTPEEVNKRYEEVKDANLRFNERFAHLLNQKPIPSPDYDYDNRDELGRPRVKRNDE